MDCNKLALSSFREKEKEKEQKKKNRKTNEAPKQR
jgi:hypothetical protein